MFKLNGHDFCFLNSGESVLMHLVTVHFIFELHALQLQILHQIPVIMREAPQL